MKSSASHGFTENLVRLSKMMTIQYLNYYQKKKEKKKKKHSQTCLMKPVLF